MLPTSFFVSFFPATFGEQHQLTEILHAISFGSLLLHLTSRRPTAPSCQHPTPLALISETKFQTNTPPIILLYYDNHDGRRHHHRQPQFYVHIYTSKGLFLVGTVPTCRSNTLGYKRFGATGCLRLHLNKKQHVYPTIRLHRPQCKTSQKLKACIVSVFCMGMELGRS